MLGKEEKVIELTEFDGIWARGNQDEVPPTHAVDCLNMKLDSKGKALTRGGLPLFFQAKSGLQILQFFQSGILPAPVSTTTADQLSYLFLDNNNNLFLNNGSSPIFSIGGFTDFAALNAFNRTFIAPNGGRGTSAYQFLQIFYNYNNTNIIRNAAGPAPRESAASFAAANSLTGNVPAGVHQFAVLYQTDTGYQTQPGPKLDFKSPATTLTVSNGNPCIITSSVAFNFPNFIAGEQISVELSGATGTPWTLLNNFWIATILDANRISVPIDTTTFGAFSGSLVVHGVFTPASVTAPGNQGVLLSNIPTGPSYVVKRILLATQAGGSEFFYVPNGIINDNTTTVFFVNFFDTDLVISADSLFDQFEAIPSGTGLANYNGRIVLVGATGAFYFNTALLSAPASPESFSLVTGFVSIPTESDGNVLVSVFVLRDVLYLTREVGFWASQDNGGDPTTWPVNPIDLTIGSYSNGLCSFTTTVSGAADTGDLVMLSAREGIYIFDGVVRRPELTFKVQDLYLQIPVAVGAGGQNRIKVCQSVWTHQIFIAVPDASGYPAYLLVGDYDPLEGILDPLAIRWSRYVFPYHPTSILTQDNLLVVTQDTNPGAIFKIDPTQTHDYNNVAIDNFWQTFYATAMYGWVQFFKAVRFRGISTGPITYTLLAEDGTATSPQPTLSLVEGKEYTRLVNFVNEKMSVKIEINTLDKTMNLNRIDILAIPRWPCRPSQ